MSDEAKVERFWQLLMSPQEDRTGLWTMTTHGMVESITGQEFILRNIPPILMSGAADLLNRLCEYVIRKQAVILEGETYQGDRVTVVRFSTIEFGENEMLELLPVEAFYASQIACKHCKTGMGRHQSPWQDNNVQFPRLLAEISATQDNLDIPALAESMDLTVEEVNELFDRADAAWERIKERSR